MNRFKGHPFNLKPLAAAVALTSLSLAPGAYAQEDATISLTSVLVTDALGANPSEAAPGDTITYSIRINDASAAGEFITGIDFEDLPAGTSGIAGGSIGGAQTVRVYRDNIEPGDGFNADAAASGNDGNANFTGDWQETSGANGTQENNGEASGDIQILTNSGREVIRFRDDQNPGNDRGEGVYRIADLSSCSAAILSFELTGLNLDAGTGETGGDGLYVDESIDGTNWTELVRFDPDAVTDGTITDTYRDIVNGTYEAHSVSLGVTSVTSYIRFTTDDDVANAEGGYLDNVQITALCGSASPAIGVPPIQLISDVYSGLNYGLDTGDLDIVYSVTVDEGRETDIAYDAQVSFTDLVGNATSIGGTEQLQTVTATPTSTTTLTLRDDFGDAPESLGYTTLLVNNGPRHLIDANIFLGDTSGDLDSGGFTNGIQAAADASEDEVGGDEGIDQLLNGATTSFPGLTVVNTSYSLTLDLTNSVTSAATLYGWIDFDLDGEFDVDELATATVLASAGATEQTLTWSALDVTHTLSAGDTYARFRITTDALTTGATGTAEDDRSLGFADDGEVEDYLISILDLDYGDAPSAYGDAGHGIPSTQTLYLGPAIADVDAQTQLGGDAGVGADGDDGDGNDDESSVASIPIPSTADAGQTYSLDVTVINSNSNASADLFGWIDFDGSATFDLDEAATISTPSTGVYQLDWTVPGDIVLGDTYIRLRLTSDIAITTSTPTGVAGDGEVEDYPVTVAVPSDYGDAIDSGAGTGIFNYRTELADNGARHLLSTDLFLGDVVADSDGDALDNGSASGDDSDNTSDEGIEQLLITAEGSEFADLTVADSSFDFTVDLTNTSGGPANLYVWIDYDQNGSFDEDELASGAAISVANNNTSAVVSSVPTSDSVVGTTFMRLRLTTDVLSAGPVGDEDERSYGLANDGEVEDYRLTMTGLDFGDAPDSYGTDKTDGGEGVGPSHIQTGTLYIGDSLPDLDSDGLPDANANGDDADGDDEGGFFVPVIGTSDTSYSIDVSLINNTGIDATLFGWLDYSQDGIFQTGEAISTNVPSASTSATLSGWSFATLSPGQTYLRLRLTTDPAITTATSGGSAYDGEVEDHLVVIGTLDFGDAPDTYSTNSTIGDDGVGNFDEVGPSHGISANLYMGVAPDGEADGQPSVLADADDSNGTDDESGSIASFPLLTPSDDSYTLTVALTNTTTADTELVGWIDFDGNGFYDNDEGATVTVNDSDTSADLLWTTIPGDITVGDTFLRLRLTSDSSVATGDSATSTPKGAATDGEVEDHQITIATAYDYGDAPDTYGTDAIDGGEGFGPRHVISPQLYLGSSAPDAETDGQASADALLDDDTGTGELTTNDSTDGDEGDLFLVTIQPNQTSYTLSVPLVNTTGSNATLYGWLDLNQDGDFLDGAEEQTATVLSGSSFSQLTFTWSTATDTSGGDGLDSGNTFVRLRLSSDSGLGPTAALVSDTASNGEVEDYSVQVSLLTCDNLYGIYNTGGYERLREFDNDTVDLFTTAFQSAGVGIERNYLRFYYMEWVDDDGDGNNELYYYDPTNNPTEVDTGASLPQGGNDNYNRMAFSYEGRGVMVESASYDVHMFDPTVSGTGQTLTNAISVTNTVDISGNGGDIAFDRDDNLYMLTYTTGGGAEFYLYEIRFFETGDDPLVDDDTPVGDLVLTGSPETAYFAYVFLLLTETNSTAAQIGGMAFNYDNLIYLQGSSANTTFNWDVGITAAGGTGAIQGPTDDEPSADLASCIYPYIRAIIEPVKTVVNSTSGDVGFVPDDILEYAVVVRNAGGFPSFDTTFQDDIQPGTTYVPNSTTMNGDAIPDLGGLMPFVVGREIHTDGQAEGTVFADITPGIVGDNEVVITYSVQVDGDIGGASICNQGFVDYEANLAGVIPTNDPGTGAADDATCLSQTSGFSVSGTVFEDYNVDGIQSSSEPGIEEVTVILYDSVTGTCESVLADANGFFEITGVDAGPKTIYEFSGEAVAAPAVCTAPSALGNDPTGYLSTTSNSTNIYVINADVTGLQFGDVLQPSLNPDLQSVIAPGGIQTYSHLFRAPTNGSVSFAEISTDSPTLSGWTSTIYEDSDCSGELTAGDYIITSDISLLAGESICLLNRVFAPTQATAGNTLATELTATFNYDGALVSDQDVEANDLTTVLDSGDSALQLAKRVQNITDTSTEFDTTAGISNGANPGDRLRYEVGFTNTGVGNISDIDIYDAIPAFTELAEVLDVSCNYTGPAAAPLSAIVPPTIMTNCSLITPSGGSNAVGYEGTLHWQLTGTLRPGESGLIVFTVDVK